MDKINESTSCTHPSLLSESHLHENVLSDLIMWSAYVSNRSASFLAPSINLASHSHELVADHVARLFFGLA